ncbi:hypothetical protein BGZ54_001952 [Gamsiella multidivaricata]|nr:hypothetical protein BGZ54_001952 [Gamsiella multidivaricata]
MDQVALGLRLRPVHGPILDAVALLIPYHLISKLEFGIWCAAHSFFWQRSKHMITVATMRDVIVIVVLVVMSGTDIETQISSKILPSRSSERIKVLSAKSEKMVLIVLAVDPSAVALTFLSMEIRPKFIEFDRRK